MKKRNYLILIVAMLLLSSMAFFLDSAEQEDYRYEALKKEFDFQFFANDAITFFDSYGKLPQDQSELVIAIQGAMKEGNTNSYCNFHGIGVRKGVVLKHTSRPARLDSPLNVKNSRICANDSKSNSV